MWRNKGLSILGVGALWMLSLGIPGCSESTSDTPAGGIYQITDWTLNDNSCKGEGHPIRAPHDFVSLQPSQTEDQLMVDSCDDEECDRTSQRVNPIAWTLSECEEGGWTESRIDMREGSHSCIATRTVIRATCIGTERLRVDIQQLAPVQFLKSSCYSPDDACVVCANENSLGACSIATAQRLTENQPCAAQQVVIARLVRIRSDRPHSDQTLTQDPTKLPSTGPSIARPGSDIDWRGDPHAVDSADVDDELPNPNGDWPDDSGRLDQ